MIRLACKQIVYGKVNLLEMHLPKFRKITVHTSPNKSDSNKFNGFLNPWDQHQEWEIQIIDVVKKIIPYAT